MTGGIPRRIWHLYMMFFLPMEMSMMPASMLPQDITAERSFSSKCGRLILDNANIFKAFIGTNFLAASFGLSMSGLYLGIAGLILIASATVHCCYMIVKCKRFVIEDIVQRFNLHPDNSPLHRKLVDNIEKSMSYGDISRLTLGKWGIWITNFSLIITQLGFCINYFIFIGNTIQRMFPFRNETQGGENLTTASPAPFLNETTTTASFSNMSHIVDIAEVSTAPRYELLMLIPLPMFLGFAYLRKIRQLGSSSIIANGSVFIAYSVVMYYILKDFKVNDGVVPVNWAKFPVFFGQITGAYEGIGTIIPIESSMEGNRHLYPLLLHLNVLFFTFLMASIGILGYLYYGPDVEQIIVWSLPLQDPLTLAVNITLVIAILFTFPLQVFPIVEIFEQLLFGPGRCLGPKKMVDESNINNEESNEEDVTVSEDETECLVPLPEEEDAKFMRETFKQCVVTVTIPDSVATWKRNVLRTLIVLFQAGVALTLKDSIAYFSAFTGAIGSTILGFILPCTIHLVLRGNRLGPLIWTKNIFLIVLGIAGGVSGVYVSIVSIVENSSV